MVDQKENQTLYQQLSQAVLDYDEVLSEQLCKKVIDAGLDPVSAIKQGLTIGMAQVGEYYKAGRYFIPELLLCSDALYAGLDVLKPHLNAQNQSQRAGKIIIGVVEGDIHDIGKNLLKAMFIASGWEVHDLGKDVSCQTFVEQTKKVRPDIVALSALMTTSMMVMPTVIDGIRGLDPDIKVMVGGAPMSQDVARKFGADGYAPDIVAGVNEAERLMSSTTQE
jgi:corrinoid protein of di/trimethylamine methyltransferase